MLQQITEPFSEWLKDRWGEAGANARLLMQGYPYTGFAYYDNGALQIPLGSSNNPEEDKTLWDHFWDVRLFNGDAEWHCVRNAHHWHFRRASGWNQTLTQECVLWGAPTSEAAVQGNWRRHTEMRGITVWIPRQWPLPTPSVPLALETRLLVESDPETGLAGITDSMVIGFTSPRRLHIDEELENEEDL